jgi:hypothetical protein
VNAKETVIDGWSLGGGTAMMLQIDHRESRDIDIFLSDPQQLPFLDPAREELVFDIRPADFSGDGTRFLKIAFANLGEIDFVVAQPLTSSPTIMISVEGELVCLETIPEIIVKKIHYRGSAIKPRDIFDIAAVADRYADLIITELKRFPEDVSNTLAALKKLRPEFVNGAIAQLSIKMPYRAIAKQSIERTRDILLAVR